MYVTYEQGLALKSILEGLTVNKKPRMHMAELVSEHNLLDALELDPYTELVKADILSAIEGDGIELTEDQLDELVTKVKKYDSGDYNDYIRNQVDSLLNKDWLPWDPTFLI